MPEETYSQQQILIAFVKLGQKVQFLKFFPSLEMVEIFAGGLKLVVEEI